MTLKQLTYTTLFYTLFAAVAIAQPVSRGLIAYYPFDGDTRDRSASGNNCQNAAVSYTAGKDQQANTALLCDGRNTLATSSFPLTITRDFSFSTYIKINARPGAGELRPIFGLEQFDLYLTFGLSTDSGLGFRFQAGGTAQPYVKYPMDSAVGRFAHVAIVRSNTSLKLYFKGDLVDSARVSSANLDGSGNALKIGGSPLLAQFGLGGYYNGVLDELRVYNRPLTEQEVDTLSGTVLTTGIRPKMTANKTTGLVLTHSQLNQLLDADRTQIVIDVMGRKFLGTDVIDRIQLASGTYHIVNTRGEARRVLLLD